MKRKKNYAVVTIVLLLVMMLSFTGFAEEVAEEVADEVTEEIVEDAVTATIIVDGEVDIVLTVDTEGIILSAEYVVDLVEDDEESDEEVLNPIDVLVGQSLVEGLKTLNDTDAPVAYSVTIHSEDNELIDLLEKSLEEAFGDLINIDTLKMIDSENPNAVRFMMAQQLGINPGKMNLLEKLGYGYEEEALIHYVEWAEKSVKEIMAAVKEERKGNEEVTVSATEETTTDSSNKPVKSPNANNGKGKKK